jgi:hypothetical protein
LITYETSNSGADLVESLKENKVTHILYNGSYAGSDVAQSIVGGSIPLTAESNLDLKWRMLLSDAIRNGLVEPAAQEGRIFLWRIR